MVNAGSMCRSASQICSLGVAVLWVLIWPDSVQEESRHPGWQTGWLVDSTPSKMEGSEWERQKRQGENVWEESE